MAKNKQINLLPQEEFEASTVGRILKWAMGTFRIIVIVTEMIVMGAFLSRFWLDAQNSDLNDEIRVKNAQISAQSEFEQEFRNLQAKLNIVKNLSQGAKNSSQIDLVTAKMPSDVILVSMAFDEKNILLKGSGNSEIGISQFIANLKGEKTFKTVDLVSLNSSEIDSSLTSFSIKITI